jgi:hypothetical protein
MYVRYVCIYIRSTYVPKDIYGTCSTDYIIPTCDGPGRACTILPSRKLPADARFRDLQDLQYESVHTM